MFRKDISQFLIDKKNSVVYIGSSNKNIDIYFDNIKENDLNVIKLSDLQEEEEYCKINYKLSEMLKYDGKLIILTSLEGLLEKYSLNNESLTLQLYMGLKIKCLIEILEKNNFNKKYLVEERMDFSVRGDIIDIFPLNGENPVRIEYSGGEINRIVYFSVLSQKSIERVVQANIFMNKEKEEKINFLELLEIIKKEKECEVFLENNEVLKYKLEENIFKEKVREDEIRKIYKNIDILSVKLEVLKNEADIRSTK
ncbi:MAG: transcription-repair coupling factor, partial [Cetobacterium sp.]